MEMEGARRRDVCPAPRFLMTEEILAPKRPMG